MELLVQHETFVFRVIEFWVSWVSLFYFSLQRNYICCSKFLDENGGNI